MKGDFEGRKLEVSGWYKVAWRSWRERPEQLGCCPYVWRRTLKVGGRGERFKGLGVEELKWREDRSSWGTVFICERSNGWLKQVERLSSREVVGLKNETEEFVVLEMEVEECELSHSSWSWGKLHWTSQNRRHDCKESEVWHFPDTEGTILKRTRWFPKIEGASIINLRSDIVEESKAWPLIRRSAFLNIEGATFNNWRYDIIQILKARPFIRRDLCPKIEGTTMKIEKYVSVSMSRAQLSGIGATKLSGNRRHDHRGSHAR